MEVAEAFSELKLHVGVSLAQAKAAYRAMAMEWHPDRNPTATAEAKMKSLNIAYSIVTRHLEASKPTLLETDGRSQNRQGNAQGRTEGARPQPKAEEPVKSLDQTVHITLLEAMNGCSRRFSGHLEGKCVCCSGRGHVGAINSDHKCLTCIGKGYYAERGLGGQKGRVVRCTECGGGGFVKRTCIVCKGTGKGQPRHWVVDLKIPPGVRNGAILYAQVSPGVANHGSVSERLRVKVLVSKHHLFTLEGLDLSVRVPVSIWKWYLGGELLAPTPNGVVRIQMQAMSERVTMNGQGMPDPRNSNIRGSLHIIPSIKVPTELNQEQRDLLEMMDTISTMPEIEAWALELVDWKDATVEERYPKAA